MTKQTEPNLFTFLKQIQQKTKKYKYDKKLAPAFMLTHYLAHDHSLIHIVNKINHLQFSLPDEIIYNYYYDKVPKNSRFIKWTKKTPADKKRDRIIDALKLKYTVSTNEAKRLLLHIEKIKGEI